MSYITAYLIRYANPMTNVVYKRKNRSIDSKAKIALNWYDAGNDVKFFAMLFGLCG
jgi:hypothetical protein